MAHKNDYQIQKQLDKPQTWFCKYYPARIRNVGEKEIADWKIQCKMPPKTKRFYPLVPK